MLGVFDSGVGGLNVVRELRRLLPRADILFHADTENAPYGTKTPRALKKLVRRDIDILREAGARRILIGCCTAGTVYGKLSLGDKIGVSELLLPTAQAAARATKTQKIAVLATDATVRSGAFGKAIRRILPRASVTEIAAQPLVALAEAGKTSLSDTEAQAALTALLPEIRASGADTLLLGCTHFPSFGEALSELVPEVTLVSSAAAGAEAFAERLAPWETVGEGKFIKL